MGKGCLRMKPTQRKADIKDKRYSPGWVAPLAERHPGVPGWCATMRFNLWLRHMHEATSECMNG